MAAPADRDEALLTEALSTPPASLGARNAALLGLRARYFGDAQSLCATCPNCEAIAEFTIDCSELSRNLLPAPDALEPQRLEVDGYAVTFRVPGNADLRSAARMTQSDDAFVRALLASCIVGSECPSGAACTIDALPASVVDALSARLERLEPGATVHFELTCPACQEPWMARMDAGAVLWSELQSRAERLLLDVDALAQAYGWNEAEILALSPTRRAAYLQLVGAR